jgi:hypothetical protein
MCCSPPADPLHVTGPLEVVGVARLPQPAGLALLFAHPTTRGCGTITLTPPVPGVGNKARIAMQALGARRRSSHRPEEDASLTPNPTRPLPKKPPGRKNRRRKNRLRPIRKKTHPKNTPPIPLFKPPPSSGLQLGADTFGFMTALLPQISPSVSPLLILLFRYSPPHTRRLKQARRRPCEP